MNKVRREWLLSCTQHVGKASTWPWRAILMFVSPAAETKGQKCSSLLTCCKYFNPLGHVGGKQNAAVKVTRFKSSGLHIIMKNRFNKCCT